MTGLFRYPFLNPSKQRQYLQAWSVKLFRILGIEIRVVNPHLLTSHALIVANHLSWLDIYLINIIQPSRFIAKDSIRSWPLIGWLAKKAGTVFLKRDNPRELRNTFRELVQHLKADEFFVFFPEGTSGIRQGQLLPFHANFFGAAIEAGVAVQPCAMFYLNAENDYHPALKTDSKLSLVTYIRRVLKAEKLIAEIVVLPPLQTAGMARRALSDKAFSEIETALHTHASFNPPGYRPETPPDQPAAQP